MFTKCTSMLGFALLATLMLSGCSESTTPEATPATTVVMVNETCPMMGGKVDPEATVEWNGQTVGFCCPECMSTFEELSDEEKTAKLAAAVAGEVENQMDGPELGITDPAS